MNLRAAEGGFEFEHLLVEVLTLAEELFDGNFVFAVLELERLHFHI